jgi:hypothetical protein
MLTWPNVWSLRILRNHPSGCIRLDSRCQGQPCTLPYWQPPATEIPPAFPPRSFGAGNYHVLSTLAVQRVTPELQADRHATCMRPCHGSLGNSIPAPNRSTLVVPRIPRTDNRIPLQTCGAAAVISAERRRGRLGHLPSAGRVNLALSGRKCQISALRLVCPIAPYPRLQVFVFYSLCLLMRPCERLSACPVQVATSPSASVGVTVTLPSGSPGFASAPASTSAKDAHTRPLHIFFSLGLRSAWEEKCLSFGSPRSSRRIKRKKRPG